LLEDNVGSEGKKYFSVVFSLFVFVMMGNLLGLLPYSFTFTSHLGAVGGLSVLGLIYRTCVGIKKKGWGFLHTFMPKGIPFFIAPIMVPIEIISYLSKPFSLTVRLVANMTVGHIMVKTIAGFVFALGVGGVVPIIFNSCIFVFEIFVALLQAFIYTVLSCIYLSDALHDH
jgi:F-type H+-transporting ATPase subunit a